MSSSSLITGMGAALVDLFADVSDPELAQIGSEKASMSLIDAARSSAMQETLSVHTHQPGGAAANTIAGIAHLGQAAGFLARRQMMLWAPFSLRRLARWGFIFRSAPGRQKLPQRATVLSWSRPMPSAQCTLCWAHRSQPLKMISTPTR